MPVSFGLCDPCSGVGCGPDDSGGDAVYSLHLRMGCLLLNKSPVVCVGASTQLITIVRWVLGALESDRCSLCLGSLTYCVTLDTLLGPVEPPSLHL